MLVDSWPGRLRGYLARPEPRPGEGMLLARCNAVHMFGLDFALDLIFLCQRGEVVETIAELGPWKRTSRIGGARFALELPVGTLKASHTKVGDRFVWTSPEPVFHPSPSPEGLPAFESGDPLRTPEQSR